MKSSCYLNRVIAISICIIAFASQIFATHNRAGEISYTQLSDLSIRAVVTTYTKTSSVSADRDSISIAWGDGSFSNVVRINGNGQILPNNIKKNVYIAEHSYPGRGSYLISVQDPNRVDNILNIDPPNSVNIPFYIQTSVSLLNLLFQYPNHSVQLLQEPIDFACVGKAFTHNPAAYDEDGDSLSFELGIPLMATGTIVPNYFYPNQIQAGLNNNISLDSKDGTFRWTSPQKAGEYNIVIIVHEYRKGIRISSTMRDMQIFVRNDCRDNQPPFIQTITDTCVVAGTKLEIPIFAFDPDSLNPKSKIKIEANGAAFYTDPPAQIDQHNQFQNSPIRATLSWQTTCSHVRKEYYFVVLKVTDNYLDTTGLAYLHTIRIKVVGPAPENLSSKAEQNSIRLQWQKPYDCETFDDIFRGFSVWRKEQSTILTHDTCHPGLPVNLYTQIAYLTKNVQGNQYYYIDSLVQKSKFYCYRVLGEFAKINASGYPVNFESSLHSNETCNSLAIENPVLLNVDVQRTDSLTGQVNVKWLKPDPLAFDTIRNSGPYLLTIEHKIANTNWNNIPQSIKTYTYFNTNWDTLFLHQNINTKAFQHNYRVQLLPANQSDHRSDSAQSIYLTLQPNDKSIQLNWYAKTPWTNYKFIILRLNENTQAFDSIGTTSLNTYTDNQLQNQKLYCYKIKAYGTYGILSIEQPLLNHSNEQCAVPEDKKPPCCPVLNVTGPCNQELHQETISNKLNWTNPNLSCTDHDAIGYRLYYYIDSKKVLLTEINDISTLEYEHVLSDIIPNCYGISAFDSLNNECPIIDTVCVQYCPIYKLPNTFTPNQDGSNDIFKPYPFRFVDKIEFKLINRWGKQVFETTDPKINWDGKDESGNPLPDGVYFYSCIIYYSGFQTNLKTKDQLTGFIELLRGKPN